MIITLLPLFLAGRIGEIYSPIWKNGAEMTYIIHNHATITYPASSNDLDQSFDLTGKMSCQQTWKKTQFSCALHDINVKTSFIDDKSSKIVTDFVQKDIWTKKALQQDIFTMEFDKNGVSEILVNKDVNDYAREMIGAYGYSLDVGLDLSKKIEGDFEKKANITNGFCKTVFFITRAATPENTSEKNPREINNLFLINQPNNSLTRAIEITRKIEDNNCSNRRYTALTHRELIDLKPEDYDVKVESAENFMTISNSNFTSFSKSKIQISNFKKNTKYFIDESINVSLYEIIPLGCGDDKTDILQTNCSDKDVEVHSG